MGQFQGAISADMRACYLRSQSGFPHVRSGCSARSRQVLYQGIHWRLAIQLIGAVRFAEPMNPALVTVFRYFHAHKRMEVTLVDAVAVTYDRSVDIS